MANTDPIKELSAALERMLKTTAPLVNRGMEEVAREAAEAQARHNAEVARINRAHEQRLQQLRRAK